MNVPSRVHSTKRGPRHARPRQQVGVVLDDGGEHDVVGPEAKAVREVVDRLGRVAADDRDVVAVVGAARELEHRGRARLRTRRSRAATCSRRRGARSSTTAGIRARASRPPAARRSTRPRRGSRTGVPRRRRTEPGARHRRARREGKQQARSRLIIAPARAPDAPRYRYGVSTGGSATVALDCNFDRTRTPSSTTERDRPTSRAARRSARSAA